MVLLISTAWERCECACFLAQLQSFSKCLNVAVAVKTGGRISRFQGWLATLFALKFVNQHRDDVLVLATLDTSKKYRGVLPSLFRTNGQSILKEL